MTCNGMANPREVTALYGFHRYPPISREAKMSDRRVSQIQINCFGLRVPGQEVEIGDMPGSDVPVLAKVSRATAYIVYGVNTRYTVYRIQAYGL